MRIFLTAIVTLVVTSALWLLTLRYKPQWIASIMLDSNGFPRIRKTGDRYVVGGKLYYFNGSIWVELSSTTGFPINPAPTEGDTFIINGIGYKYTNGAWVKITGPIDSETTRTQISSKQKCVKHNYLTGSGISGSYYTYNGLATTEEACKAADGL